MNKSDILKIMDDANISYECTEHTAVYTMEEMMEAHIPHPESIAKNLFIRDDKKRAYYLITVRENRTVNLKEFQARYGTRRLSFASENDLAAILQLQRGSVTPFGLLNDAERCVKFFIDRDFEGNMIGVHPCVNTATVHLRTEDLIFLIRQHGNSVTWMDCVK